MEFNLSDQVRHIISYGRGEAVRLGNDFIGVEHLFLGLLREGTNTAYNTLQSLKVDLAKIKMEIELSIKSPYNVSTNINGLPLTQQADNILRLSILEAKYYKSVLAESEHMMLAILKIKKMCQQLFCLN